MDFILPEIIDFQNGTWLDEQIEPATGSNLRYWHIIFMGIGIFLSVGELENYSLENYFPSNAEQFFSFGLVVMLCCCFRFRIPRTKQVSKLHAGLPQEIKYSPVHFRTLRQTTSGELSQKNSVKNWRKSKTQKWRTWICLGHWNGFSQRFFWTLLRIPRTLKRMQSSLVQRRVRITKEQCFASSWYRTPVFGLSLFLIV